MNTKVILMYDSFWQDNPVIAVFSSDEKADAAIAQYKELSNHNPFIVTEEFIVDESPTDRDKRLNPAANGG